MASTISSKVTSRNYGNAITNNEMMPRLMGLHHQHGLHRRRVVTPDFRLTYGLRYDYYESAISPRLIPISLQTMVSQHGNA